MAKAKPAAEDAVEFPANVLVVKYGDKIPVEVKDADHYADLIATHGAQNVEAA